MEAWTTAAPWLGVAGLIAAFIVYTRVKAGDAGSAEMVEISDDIHDGAMAFLKREYSILLVFVAVVFVALWLGVRGPNGGSLPRRCGLLDRGRILGHEGGHARQRPHHQAANREGPGAALSMAFAGGAVMGLAVASLGLLGISLLAQLFGVWETRPTPPPSTVSPWEPPPLPSSPASAAASSPRRPTWEPTWWARWSRTSPRTIPATRRHRRQRGRQRGRRGGHGRRHLRVLRRFRDRHHRHCGHRHHGDLGALAPGLAAEQARLAAMAYPLTVIMVGLVASLAGVLAVRVLQNTDPGGALRYATFCRQP